MKRPRLQELESAVSDGEATRQAIPAEHREQHMAAHSLPVPRRRLLMVCSHVVQYSSPVFQKLAQDGRLEFLVAYCSMQGAQRGVDPGFGVEVSWDTSLLEGYPFVHVPNRAARPGMGRFFGLLNPGLWKLIRHGKFDAVFVSGYFYASAWIAIMAAKWYRIPILFTTEAHSLRSWAIQSKWKLRFKGFLVRRILSLGKVLLSMSSGAVQQLKALGFLEDRIVLSPYAVDNDWWIRQAALVDRDSVRRSWQVPASAPVALFCAKLQPWKAPLDALEAFARANVPESYIVFAGEGPLRGAIEQRARELGVSKRARFLGFVNQSQLPSVYCGADLLVLPSLYEPFGLVVNEAMLCGRPVAVSDRVGAKYDLVREKETGYVFPAGDVDELAAILREFLANPEKRDRMGHEARKRMATWSPREYVEGLVRAVELAAQRR
jgi:glycosyltransferase involved in cell wall biosynthesis